MKIMSRRLWVMIVVVSMILLPWKEIEVKAETTILYSGTDGDLGWSIDSDGLLTVTGEGNYELNNEKACPDWCQYGNYIISANVEVSGITSARGMFAGCSNMRKIDLSKLDTSAVTDMRNMFAACGSVYYSTLNLDLSGFDTSNVTNMAFMFGNSSGIRHISLKSFDTSKVTDMSGMFLGCSNVDGLDLSGFDTSKVTNMSNMFYYCSKIEKLEVSGFNTSKVTDMTYMFGDCKKLKQLDLKKFDTSNVTSMGNMFSKCSSLTELNLSKFDTSNTTNMVSMFYGCNNLKMLDVSDFDTSKVTDMYGMFCECSNLTTLDVSNFDTSRVKSMNEMFCECSNLTTLDVSNFNTSNVKDMKYMFRECSNLKSLDVSNFNTSNVKDMYMMFYKCSNLMRLDISNFDTSNIDEYGEMFSEMNSLSTVEVGVNVRIAIQLPSIKDNYWTDENGNVVTVIKTKLPTSMTYIRRKGSATIDVTKQYIHCSSSYNISVNEDDSIPVTIVADTYDELKTIVNSVVAQSTDTSVAMVEDLAFVLPTKAITYSGQNTTYSKWTASGILKVKGKAEGNTTIIISESGGESAVCQIAVNDESSNGEIGDEGFRFGENISGSADSSVAEFFPTDWSLASTVYPVDIEIKEDNGLYKIRIAIGVKKGGWLKDDATWNEFKSNVKDYKDYINRYQGIRSYAKNVYKEKWGLKYYDAITASGFKKKPKISVMAYYEGTFDKNRKLICSESEFGTDASVKGSLSWQFTTPIGPMYLNLSMSCKAAAKASLQYNWQKDEFRFPGGSVTVTPSVSLEGGYGIDKVATIGAKGSLSLPITVIPCTKAELKASAKLRCYLLFVIDIQKELVSYRKELWNTIDKQSMVSTFFSRDMMVMNSNTEMSELDTSFADKTSEWLPDKKEENTMLAMGASEDDYVTKLQDGILPSSLPMQIEIGNKKVLLFQSYDSARDILNGTVLMYSVKEEGVWSEPQAVYDNGCADMYADMKVIDGKLVLVWQKIKEKISGDIETASEVVLDEYASNSEICLSVFDEVTNTFSTPSYVTDNSSCDMMPKLCENTKEIIVSWVNNDKLDFSQKAGTNRICTATWDGTSVISENTIAVAPGTVDDYVVYKNKDEIQASFVGKNNGISALFDTNGNVLNVMSNLFFSSEDGEISRISYRDDMICARLNGVLYSYNVLNGYISSYNAGQSAFGNEIEYCTNGDKGGYIWSVYNEDDDIGTIYASMETENGFSDPIALCEKKGVMWRSLSPTLDANGNWSIITNVLDTETNLNSVSEVKIEQKNEVELATARINQENVRNDGLSAISYHVINTGDTTVKDLDIQIILKNGDRIIKKVSTNILPGNSELGTAYIDLREVKSAQNVDLSVSAKEQKDLARNTVSVTIGQADVSILATHMEKDNKVQISATLTNQSSLDAKTAVRLYSDVTKEKELDVSEEIDVFANDSKMVTFTLNKEEVTYNENNAAYLMIQAVTEGGDYKQDNDVAYVVLYKGEEQEQFPIPTAKPTPVPTSKPTLEPILIPTPKPTVKSTAVPTMTPMPTVSPSVKPSMKPEETPVVNVTPEQTKQQTEMPMPSLANNFLHKWGQNTLKINSIKVGNILTKKKMKYKITKIDVDGNAEVSLIGTNSKKSDKNLKKLIVKDTIKIGGKAFKITSIDCKAFNKYKYLKKIVIGKNITKINRKAFYKCKNVKQFVIRSTRLKVIESNVIYGINKKAVIKVPNKQLKKYKKLFKVRTGYKKSMKLAV